MPPPRLKLMLKPQLMPTTATTADTDTVILDTVDTTVMVDTTEDTPTADTDTDTTSVRPKLNLRLKPPPMLTMATTAVDTDITVWDITVMVPDTTATTDMPVTVTPPTPT